MREDQFSSVLTYEDGDLDSHGEAAPTDDDEPRRLVSIKTAARVLGGITPREVYKRIDACDLEAVHIGRRRMIVVESLDSYVARLRAEARSAA